jgi:hypothetical protein
MLPPKRQQPSANSSTPENIDASVYALDTMTLTEKAPPLLSSISVDIRNFRKHLLQSLRCAT